MAEVQDGTGLGLPRGGTVGRYIVLSLLGDGGMGIVYAAYDPELDRKVALKLLRVRDKGPGGNTADKRARLLREAKAMARLSHPNVIVVYDVGTIDDQVFIAMELVDGATVTKWREGKPREWKEVLDIFAPAGHALAAAHAAGLVHRDFKPDNVMVGRDGKVRVMDFGLARQLERSPTSENDAIPELLEPEPDPAATAAAGAAESAEGAAVRRASPAAGEPEVRLTHEGMVVGTPAYMPPEQYMGKSDARTDQFAFCVALYECLYGEYPFEGKTAFGLTGNAVAGRTKEPPQNTRVPLWLRKVVLRGLRPNPDDRYSSMEALLAALGKDPAARRRRWLIGAGAVGFATVVAFGVNRAADSRRAFCAAGPARIAAAWELPPTGRATPEGPRRVAVRSALLATGKPYAPDTVRGVFRVLDDYATRWAGLYRETCEATHVRGEQSAEVLDLRMACLNDRLSGLKALTDLYAEATGEVVERAVDAAHALTPLDGCSDVRQLKSLIPPPQQTVKARVDEIRAELGKVKALHDSGRFADALKRLEPLASESRSLSYRPLQAEVMTRVAWAEVELHRNAAAEAALEEAFTASMASRHDDLIAEIAAHMVWVLGFQERFKEAERWSHFAEAALERTGYSQQIPYAWLLNNVATVHFLRGRYAEAIEYNQRARDLKERALGVDSPDVAISLANIAIAFSALGRGQDALRENERALRIMRLSLGASHPRVGDQLNNRGEIFLALSKSDDALQAFSEAQRISEREVGANDPATAYALSGVGRALIGLGRAKEAVPPLERALKIREERDPDDGRVGEVAFALARALWDSRQEARALGLAKRSLEAYSRTSLHSDQSAEVRNWLLKHSGPEALVATASSTASSKN